MVDCWLWDGARDKDGYGLRAIRRAQKTTNLKAHRLVYEALVGSIGSGLELDHLCKNPGCVNPNHLEPVTREENRRRGAGTEAKCWRGHPFDEANTYRYRGARCCRRCHADRQYARTHP